MFLCSQRELRWREPRRDQVIQSHQGSQAPQDHQEGSQAKGNKESDSFEKKRGPLAIGYTS